MEDFVNNQVEVSSIPTVEEVVFVGLDKQYFKIVLFWAIIRLLLCFVIGLSVFFFSDLVETALPIEKNKYVLSLFIICIGICNVILSVLAFKQKGYAVRKYDIIYQTGLINKKQIVIPFNRVQHIEVYEGAIARIYGLCELEFFTAGGQMGDLSIPGLKLQDAERIKAYVITKVQPLAVTEDSLNTEENE
ncbi:PH domain-containing protein [Myroides sp. LoEW2-1]|uniref:PH domain-containing protein n=1 Tax=Myroides sp. LoEW2-1 TaxID=2683192 RepID=UPI001324BF39|nr:PH domain-containing protein [Myroides sp. LoEW2-1]MVX34903.1 PH domain-containing protein [Myroides sp. LoEW2-1]